MPDFCVLPHVRSIIYYENLKNPLKFNGILALKNDHSNVAAIEKNLIQFCDSTTFGGCLAFCYILQQHVDEIIETLQSSYNLLVVFHNDMYSRTDALVN